MKHRRKKTAASLDLVRQVFKRKIGQRIWTTQQAINLIAANYEVPEGYYAIYNNRLYCPKKRNEVIRINYYSLHEEELR